MFATAKSSRTQADYVFPISGQSAAYEMDYLRDLLRDEGFVAALPHRVVIDCQGAPPDFEACRASQAAEDAIASVLDWQLLAKRLAETLGRDREVVLRVSDDAASEWAASEWAFGVVETALTVAGVTVTCQG